MVIYNKVYILIILVLITFVGQSFAQENDNRTKNRRIADSLYYIHTIKKQADSIKQTNLKKLKTENEINISKSNKNNEIDSWETNSKFPSNTLYRNTWETQRVKNGNISLKDLPDEIILRLQGKDGNETFYFPYKGIKTSGYGWRWNRPHTGLDIALKTGDKIYAAFDGIVRVAKYNGGYGNMVLIRHYNNLETLYGHMSEIKVKAGQKVKAGDVIGLGGSTGHSTGPHLHFECRLLYACFDPEWIVDLQHYRLKTKIIRIDKSYFGISSSQAMQEKKQTLSKLTKVDKLLDGTKYVSDRELKKIIETKENEKYQPVVINNEDKTTWRYYTVKTDDNLDKISKRFNITKTDLIKINNIKEDGILIENQRIRIR